MNPSAQDAEQVIHAVRALPDSPVPEGLNAKILNKVGLAISEATITTSQQELSVIHGHSPREAEASVVMFPQQSHLSSAAQGKRPSKKSPWGSIAVMASLLIFVGIGGSILTTPISSSLTKDQGASTPIMATDDSASVQDLIVQDIFSEDALIQDTIWPTSEANPFQTDPLAQVVGF